MRVSRNVTLIAYTRPLDGGSPERLVAAAARLCYTRDVDRIFEMDDERMARFIRRLRDDGHLSPFEHISFTFLVTGISRACSHQIVRHRVGVAYTQQSQRYVAINNFDYVMPPQLEGVMVETPHGPVEAEHYFEGIMRDLSRRYAELQAALGGAKESSNENARFVLPNACATNMMITMNARELMHFCNMRLCQRAQWEIRGVAEDMLRLAKSVAPNVFDGVGPKCLLYGYCPEGDRGCGRYTEMVERYGSKRDD